MLALRVAGTELPIAHQGVDRSRGFRLGSAETRIGVKVRASSGVSTNSTGLLRPQVHQEMTECHHLHFRLRFGVFLWRHRYWPCCVCSAFLPMQTRVRSAPRLELGPTPTW